MPETSRPLQEEQSIPDVSEIILRRKDYKDPSKDPNNDPTNDHNSTQQGDVTLSLTGAHDQAPSDQEKGVGWVPFRTKDMSH